VWRTAFGILLVVHGLLTILIWSPTPSGGAPMDTSHSWLFGDARTLSLLLALTAGPIVAVAGVCLLSHQAWWSLIGLAGGVLSLALFAMFFTPWWLAAIAISASLVWSALHEGVPA
jgi:hypothetical protein